MTELRRVEAVSSLGHSVTAGTPEHSGTLDDGTCIDLSCHRRPWRSHLRSTPCCHRVIRVLCRLCAPAARPRRGHPASDPHPRPSDPTNGPTTLRDCKSKRPAYTCSGGAEKLRSSLQGAAAGTPTAGTNSEPFGFGARRTQRSGS